MRIVFDFDGTVANTMPLIADAAAGIVNKRFGVPLDEAAAWYWGTAGLPFAEQLNVLSKSYDMSTAQLLESVVELSNLVEMIYEVAEPWHDAIPAFEALDYDMHLVSATSASLTSKFTYKWFPFALEGLEDQIKFQALQMISARHKIVYIGDMPNDGSMAQAVGARFIGVDRGIELPWSSDTEVVPGLLDALDRL